MEGILGSHVHDYMGFIYLLYVFVNIANSQITQIVCSHFAV